MTLIPRPDDTDTVSLRYRYCVLTTDAVPQQRRHHVPTTPTLRLNNTNTTFRRYQRRALTTPT